MSRITHQTWTDASPAPAAPAEIGAWEDLGPIGQGGMGTVRRVRDPQLPRALAMKTLRPELVGHAAIVERFDREARTLAALQHPSIVPVHAFGRLPDGRPFFTMPEVRGRSFEQVLAERAALRPDIEVFRRVCEAVAYAHSRGVLHRDLKPDNVMVGEFGEVLLMDWGLARGAGEAEIADEGPDIASESASGLTRVGAVIGTPGYMSPEQARGDAVDTATDVYALGALLYRILAGRPPFDGEAALQAVRTNAEPSPPPGPEPLVALCRRAMAARAADRPAATEVIGELDRWVQGVERRERALALVAASDPMRGEVEALRSRARALREEARSDLERRDIRAPVAEKQGAWALEDEADRIDRAADLREGDWLRTLSAALAADDVDEAHLRLADHYRTLHDALDRTDGRQAMQYDALVRVHDRGRHAAWLRGDAAVSLRTDVEARVIARPYVEHERRLVPGDALDLGATPLDARALPAGSWLLEIAAPGREVVRYPVFMGRGEHWEGVAPGDTAPRPIRLPRPGEVGAGERYVPAGWFQAGGDSEASGAIRRTRLWADGFVISAFHVSFGEYRAFLNDLPEGEAEENIPRNSSMALFAPGADGRYEAVADSDGEVWLDTMPVMLIRYPQALAYAAWRAAREALPWRLPNEWEWEKAARGADARVYPWGSHYEPSYALSAISFPDSPKMMPADTFPIDESPYGVRNMAGWAGEWTDGRWRFDGTGPRDRSRVDIAEGLVESLKIIRGGSGREQPAHLRVAARLWTRGSTSGAIGFRTARPFG